MHASSSKSDALYDSGGEGPALVLLHGLGGTWHIWKPVLGLLADHHRVLALTLPGHRGGPSLPPGAEPTIDALTDGVERCLDAHGIAYPHVAGNSLGGWIALELARRGRARTVTALSPAGAWRSREDFRKVEKPFRLIFALMALMIFLTACFLRFASVRRMLNRQVMERGERVPAPDFRDAMESMRQTYLLPALLTSMGQQGGIRPMQVGSTPVRIAWCSEDRVIPFEIYGKPMLEKVHGAEGIILQGVGHVPMYDDPELIAQTLLETAARAEVRVA